MRSIKPALVCAFALGAAILLPAERARAQGWFGRAARGWRANGWWDFPASGQLGGGEVVGTVPFASGRPPAATLTDAQWQQLVIARQRQTPTMSAAQWHQLVTSQVQQPQPTLTPAQQQRLNVLRAAQQRQQPNDPLGEALRQWQQQNAPPPRPAKE
jgi:hypothetical protein